VAQDRPEQPGDEDEVLVLSRPAPLGLRVAVLLLPALAFLPFSLFSLPALGVVDAARVPELLEQVEAWPFGAAAAVGTLVAAILGPIAGFLLAVSAVRRRFGRCELAADHARFQIALAPRRLGRVSVAYADVTSRVVTPSGLRVTVGRWGPLSAWLSPLLIPARTEAEVARVVERLDASEPTPADGADEAAFGPEGAPARLVVALVVGILALSAVPALVLAARFGAEAFVAGWLPGLLLHAGLFTWLDVATLRPFCRRLRVGADGLIVGARRHPYAELTALYAADGLLAWTCGRRRGLNWVGPALPEAAAVLEERLARAGRELRVQRALPAWAAPRAIRRRRAALIGLGLLLAGLATAAASLPRPAYDAAIARLDLYGDVAVSDDEGQYAHLVYRLGDEAPRFLLLEGAGVSAFNHRNDTIRVPGLVEQELGLAGRAGLGEDVVVDLGAGEARDPSGAFSLPGGATFLHVRPSGRRTSAGFAIPLEAKALLEAAGERTGMIESLPALLEPLLAEVDDPALRDFVLGRTSRRVHEAADDDGWRLLWGVDHGDVVFVVVLAADRGVAVDWGDLDHVVAGPRPAKLSKGAASVLLEREDGALQALAASPPGFAALVRATEAVRGGRSVREVTAGLLEGGLSPAGGR